VETPDPQTYRDEHGVAVRRWIGVGLFKDVPTKAITLMAQAGSSVSTGTLTMPNMMGDGQFDVRPVGDMRRAAVTIFTLDLNLEAP
jgi:hypothetical protein